ncbi:T45 [Tupaiid betaherpesvirus 1]|uniref:Ribonucleoside-diphosphate reductase large subunit-like protein n=1 Tax=Tupaiid herpesvirus 1 (strain 1) TaxID=10397 RepID=Q91TP4_TUHV1|nr:T45 [Tupaiid betaherpesvirus 1]AAK57093.1 T45 [Tupaiid betaherpesvirus 1]
MAEGRPPKRPESGASGAAKKDAKKTAKDDDPFPYSDVRIGGQGTWVHIRGCEGVQIGSGLRTTIRSGSTSGAAAAATVAAAAAAAAASAPSWLRIDDSYNVQIGGWPSRRRAAEKPGSSSTASEPAAAGTAAGAGTATVAGTAATTETTAAVGSTVETTAGSDAASAGATTSEPAVVSTEPGDDETSFGIFSVTGAGSFGDDFEVIRLDESPGERRRRNATASWDVSLESSPPSSSATTRTTTTTSTAATTEMAVPEAPPIPPATATGRRLPLQDRYDGQGKFRPIRCYCHGELGWVRYCVDWTSPAAGEEADALIERLERSVRLGPAERGRELFHVVFFGAGRLVQHHREMDYCLGARYLQTNPDLGSCATKPYARTDRFTPAVSDYLAEHGARVCDAAKRCRRRYDKRRRTLLSSLTYVNEIANVLDGREECPLAVAVRVALALAVRSTEVCYGGSYLKVLAMDETQEVFEQYLDDLYSERLLGSVNALAQAGLNESAPQEGFSGRIDDQDVEVWLDENAQRLLGMMKDGLALSLNVTRGYGHAVDVIYLLAAQARLCRSRQRRATFVRVYFDLWHTQAAAILELIERSASGLDGVEFAVNVPNLFFERERHAKSHWTMFPYEHCAELNERTGAEFATVYVQKERNRCGWSVSLGWLYARLVRAVLTGRLAVVFPDNVGVYGPLLGTMQNVPTLGPHVDMLNVCVERHVPVVRFNVNVDDCYEENVPDGRVSEMDLYIVSSGLAISLCHFRRLVRAAVVAGDLLLEEIFEQQGPQLGVAFQRYRPLCVGYSGLHTLLLRVGVEYDSDEAVTVAERLAEHLYYEALRTSVDLCIAGLPACSWFGHTRYSRGLFAFERHGRRPCSVPERLWDALREDMSAFGMRNAQLVSLGPGWEQARLAGVSASFYPLPHRAFREPCRFPGVDASVLEAVAPFGGADEQERRPSIRMPGVSHVLAERVQLLRSARPSCRLAPDLPPGTAYRLSRAQEPYVDHAVAPVIYVKRAAAEETVAVCLKMANRHGAKVGVYKCCVREK